MSYKTSATLILVGLLAGCQNKGAVDADDLPDSASKGAVRVEITGGEGEVNSSVEEAWIRVDDVQVKHVDKGWISVLDERQDVDLLSLGADSQLIGKGDVYEGSYDGVKLFVADSWIVVDGVEQDLTIVDSLQPDILTEGIDFDESFFVQEGSTTTLLIDWDLGSQLQDDQGEWKLGTDATVSVDLVND